ncbi:curved DNA-binding protein CbpA [Arthrobacter sp. SORGH_AS 212]|uniref:J domain-containing protein n=1 Tax=Pseudarthrobacter sp. SORGH_AS 212 TaxID=3041777 RepID=UPI0027846AF7|nr:curved DNA-binding protein CbpA [Arthrobacter sp. SORGH_AS_0212]
MMARPPDYYAILNVPPDAGRLDIARAYRGLMRAHHPDVGPADSVQGSPGDELLRIMDAYGVLRDPARRAAYDRQRTLPTDRTASTGQPLSTARPVAVRKVPGNGGASGDIIRVTPVRWESGPWA